MSSPTADAALAVWRAALAAAGCGDIVSGERVAVAHAVGRVATVSARAVLNSPSVPCAAMDGIAVRAIDTVGSAVRAGGFDIVDTGDPLPTGRDAVVMREHVRSCPDGSVLLAAPARVGEHVRAVGEAVAVGDELVPAGRVLRPADLAAAAAGGLRTLDVRRRPVVAVVPTGDEVRPVGVDLAPGELVDTNSLLLGLTLREIGCEVQVFPVQPDDPAVIASAVQHATVGADLVLVLAGSSAGRDDHAARVVQLLGSVVVHGVAVRPAHPVLLGVLHGAPPVPVIGVPGYPVSAALALELFAVPLLVDLQRRQRPRHQRLTARLAAPVASRAGVEEYVLMTLGADASAAPLPRGSGAQLSLARADSVLRIPADCAGFATGDLVAVDVLDGPGWAARQPADVDAVPPPVLASAVGQVVRQLV